MFHSLRPLAIVLLALFIADSRPIRGETPKDNNATSEQPTDAASKPHAPVEAAALGETRNVHRCEAIYLAGQPSQADIPEIKAAGITKVVNLRTDSEMAWDEGEQIRAAGLAFLSLPFRAPEELTDQLFEAARQALTSADADEKVLLHCASANRVGAIWLAHRVLDKNVSLKQAQREASTIGLKTEAYKAKALDYIRRRSKSPETP